MANIGIPKAIESLESYLSKSFDSLASAQKRLNPKTTEERLAFDNCADPKCKIARRQDELTLEARDTLVITALTVADKNGDNLFSEKELTTAKEFVLKHYTKLCALPENRSSEGNFFRCLNSFFKQHTK
jgi:hypothetical protein